MKSQKIALLLSFFFGMFGAHRFYAGKIKTGILYLFTVGLFGIGWLIDIIRICIGTFYDNQGNSLKEDCPKWITYIVLAFIALGMLSNFVKILTPIETTEINAIYTTEEKVIAERMNTDNEKEVKYEINTGDVFWISSKTGSRYTIETNGELMELYANSSIVKLERPLTIDEYIKDTTFFNKPISEVSVLGSTYNIQMTDQIGYAITDIIKLGGNVIYDSFGKDFNVVMQLSSENKEDYYIVKINDINYSYVSANYVTLDKVKFDTIVAEREEAKRLEEEARRKAEEERKAAEEAARYKYSIYEENGITYATANDIVHIAKHDTDSKYKYNLENKVCVTGKIKNIQYDSYGSLLEKVKGDFRDYYIWLSDESISIDNDDMESIIGITVYMNPGSYSEDKLMDIFWDISKSEEYVSSVDKEYTLFSDTYYWMKEQKELKEGTTIRVYGDGDWDWFDTFNINNATKLEILNTDGKVISTWGK